MYRENKEIKERKRLKEKEKQRKKENKTAHEPYDESRNIVHITRSMDANSRTYNPKAINPPMKFSTGPSWYPSK